MKQKLVIFDVDGTLVKQNSSWVTIHEYFKVDHLVYNHLKEYQKGIIDYSTFMKKDIGLYHPINGKKLKTF